MTCSRTPGSWHGLGKARRARESADVSVGELAATIGVSGAQLMAWEFGEVVPDGTPASEWVRVVRALKHRDEHPPGS